MEDNIDPSKSETEDKKPETVFKKPVLIGKIGKLPKKLPFKLAQSFNISEQNSAGPQIPEDNVNCEENLEAQPLNGPVQTPAQQPTENSIPLPYKEPSWSGLPDSNEKDYIFEVLKNGAIIETINLMDKPFWVFGRLANCDICMQHPTISRYHAVLQYRQEATETDSPGFYIYDLGSTHGTFLNKNRLKPKVFVRMQVGYMLKLGCSTRAYILNGPEYDTDAESLLSITELKQKRKEELLRREEERLKIQKEIEKKKKKEEERGVDWGLGEDADEETDLSENPYAQTNNEELYLDDPKKALRGFFEREGLNLEYDCNEQGIGQFLCKVELPVDDDMGRPIVAEVLHKGKKKETVIQCALEACRILDRYGVLRQATHESRKRKAKNWEENDYYDSDEDTFLDRTGTIEKKREKRMNAKAPQKVETYESLMDKESTISKKISDLETQLSTLQTKIAASDKDNKEEDSLDTFMKGLTDVKTDKKTVSNLKLELTQLRAEHAKIIRLVNIAKPANLPMLVSHQESGPSTSKDAKMKSLPLFGKRKKIQIKFEDKSKYNIASTDDMEDEEEEEETITKKMEVDKRETIEEKQEMKQKEDIKVNDAISDSDNHEENIPSTSQAIDSYSSSSSIDSDEEKRPAKSFTSKMTFKKFESILKKGLPPCAGKHQEKIEKIVNNLKILATNEDRINVDWKILSAKKKKVMKLILDMKNIEPDEKLEQRVSSELNRILLELNSMWEQKSQVLDKVKKMGNEIQNIFEKDFKEYKKHVKGTQASGSKETVNAMSTVTSEEKTDNSHTSTVTSDKPENSSNISDRLSEQQSSSTVDERKKKKNVRKIHQKQEKTEQERQRGYEEDSSRENYCMWVPPSDQSGDGKTNLNEKYGY